jgi:outer membrane protein TolC
MKDHKGRSWGRTRRQVWKLARGTLLGLAVGPLACQPMSHTRLGTNSASTTASPRTPATPPTLPSTTPASTGVIPTSMDLPGTDARVPLSASPIPIAAAVGELQQSSLDPTVLVSNESSGARPAARPVQPQGLGQVPNPPIPDRPDAAGRDKPRPSGGSGKKATSKEDVYQADNKPANILNGLTTPTIPPPRDARPLRLCDALSLAGVENPVIGLADQAVLAAQADRLQALTLLLPSLQAGTNYHYHQGTLQTSFGAIRKANMQSIDFGFGSGAWVAGTVNYPGLLISAPLSDAIFEPVATKQIVNQRRFQATATRNDVLLGVVLRYLDLLAAEGRLAIFRQSEADFNEVARLTADYARAGQGRQGDADRARTDLLLLQGQEQDAQGEVAVAAAELARLLNLDPSLRLQTADVPIMLVRLIDPGKPLPELLEVARRYRPEVMAAAAAIQASRIRLREEKTRPLFPILWFGYSATGFGGGATALEPPVNPNPATPNVAGTQTLPSFGHVGARTDLDFIAFWKLQNLGFGNWALAKGRRAELNAAQAERLRILNLIDQEVADAYNLSAARLRELDIARRRTGTALDGFQRDLERIRGGIGRPIEVLDSARLLLGSRQELLRTIVGYDQAQFQLFVALGQPPTLVVDDTKKEH